MPAPRSELERRVERNTNDVISIDELLTAQGFKLTGIENRVTAIEDRVTAIEAKVDTIEAKVLTIGETLSEHSGQLAEILERLPPTA